MSLVTRPDVGVARVAARLASPAPTWAREVDVVVVGSGVAGMMVALTAARVGRVLLLTKSELDAGSTSWAQGGIAAAIDLADTPSEHLLDTLVAGAGLCGEQAVRVLVEEGPQQLARLISFGMRLDHDDEGGLSLTREGGHGRARIVHAGGDATGSEVQRALMAAVAADPSIEVIENAFVLDLLLSAPRAKDGRCATAGVRTSAVTADGVESVGEVAARAVVLACGGIGQVYASTTNPPVATGDGMAVALRAGAALADIEFVQFHPTVLWQGPDAQGQQLLVSEAVRGEGAVLIDVTGARVMEGVHPMADLAPRDVVAKAISIRMAEGRGGVYDHVFLDATSIGEAKLLKRFPNIVAGCRAIGIDPVTTPIPVAPGEHFACGGVWTDRNGRTTVPGLFAVGETACTGVHGANRLASNSLLEGLVFGERVGAQLVLNLPSRSPVEPDMRPAGVLGEDARVEVAQIMSRHVAVRRTAAGLEEAAATLAKLADPSDETTRAAWEATNVHTLAAAMVAAALQREESRGCHWREDFPGTSDVWRKRIVTRLADGELVSATVDLEATP